ncbi:MAG: SOS response-associated peptidase [Anaerolineaceae bacterium]
MCGRFTMAIDADDVRTQLALGQMPIDWKARYNIAPSQEIPTVPDPTNRDVVMMRWGLVPFWATDPSIGYKMINARAETVLEKPSYKNSFKHKRCLILTDGFYEWQQAGKTKRPYFFSLKSGAPFAFAGLWDDWEPKGVSSMPGIAGITSCTIITTAANAVVSPVHPRMPVILTGEATHTWLESTSQTELVSLLKPLDSKLLQAWEVGSAVNSPANQGAELIVPLQPLT